MTEVRAATPDDAERVAEINVRTWQHAYRGIIPDAYLASLDQAAIARRFRDVTTRSAGSVLVARSPSVCGFSWMAASRDDDAASDVAEIIAIYVDPAFQRRGIGRALWLATCDAARTRGFDSITLWVLAENAGARAFYEALGFVADGETKATTRWGGKLICEVRYARATAPSRSRADEAIQWRHATEDDVVTLAGLNRELIVAEGHHNPMSLGELEKRMLGWLRAEYRAVLFLRGTDVVAYALYRPDEWDRVHVRQFLVVASARRQGIGRTALGLLRSEIIGPSRRLVLDVLVRNEAAMAFYRACGFHEYAVTLLSDE